ncbi:PRD domain-containing protein [Defluviitalea saccharophila]|uniref:PRD domain-containing protein n=1 Tax=Defluviitalea saccharophila TaxID=879970 RepID=A0ABZ2Y1S4_9FIRM|nr:PRD domain-containing protein [Candidatus Epulonipiscium sp.]
MTNKTKYQIKKVINNNVILAVDLQSHEEVILLGKGLGFGKKEKMIIDLDKSQIEKEFHTFDKKIKEEYFTLLQQLDEDVISACEEIITIAEEKLGKLNERIHIVLTDHVGFALERLKNGMDINNPFLFEIKTLYPKEFEIGKIGAEIIRNRLNTEISESEIGFIALHLHSARQNKSISETVKDTRLLKEAVEIVEKALDYKINPQDLAYYRLINHLRLAINRMEQDKQVENPLLDTIKQRFSLSFEIARDIASHIRKHKDIKITDDELGYMAIHIERLRELMKSNNE